ncbi:hypothetical protein KSP39_PZI000680 [Platanthera zijinensis]|uniref:Uncharacterized protein n=1 Tax=Platanthera zijinensis TaxID=2320716 RepID=A0AAP0C2K8_9ASPA
MLLLSSASLMSLLQRFYFGDSLAFPTGELPAPNSLISATQMRYIMESEEIRRSMEPLDLIKRIKEIEEEAYSEPDMETKQVPKQTAAVDLSKRLSDLRAMNDANSLKALVEWRKRKMDRARQREIDRNSGASGAASGAAAAQT